MTAGRRVVVTGAGLVTPFGLGAAALRAGIAAGKSAVGPVRGFDPSPLPVRIAAAVPPFDPLAHVPRPHHKRLKGVALSVAYAITAARLAADDAGLAPGAVDPDRFGVVFGSGTIPGEPADLGPAALASVDRDAGMVDMARWGRDAAAKIPPQWMLHHIPNMAAGHVAILHDARGPNNTVTQSEASGLLAVGEAFRGVKRGRADVMLAGAGDARANPITLVRHCLFSPLSRRNDEPERAARPFDRGRDGMVLGEGAGVLVLEEAGHADRRGARVLAEVDGFGAAFDRDGSGGGVARAVAAALAEAGISPAEVGHVNAHAAGTADGDAREARGLAAAVGGRVPVFAASGYVGSPGVGGGVIELAVSLLAGGVVPRTLNHDDPDPACPVAVTREPTPARSGWVVKVSCTGPGQVAALVCRAWE